MSLRQFISDLKEWLVPKGGLKERTVKSGIWSGMMNVGGRALQVFKLIILARLLSPADFGLMGIAMLTLAVLEQFSKLGIDLALIQREEENVDHYLNTAWGMQIIRGLFIAGIAFFIAPYAAAFFDEPRTTDIIRVIAIVPLLIGFRNPGIVYLRKNLEFHRQFILALSGPIANTSVSIVLAFTLRNVWALVFGSIVGTIITLLISYYVHDYRPYPEFNLELASELYGYGKWITASGIILFLMLQGDDIFVGWYLTAAALGFYQMAYRLSTAPTKEFSSVISSVIFPAYSRIQNDITMLRNTCYQSIKLVSVVSFPMIVGIIVTAPVFVPAVLGEQWLPMVAALQIMTIWGALRAIAVILDPIFKAIGRPDYSTKLEALQLIVIGVTIYPATARWGIEGTGLSIVASGLIRVPIQLLLTRRVIEGDIIEMSRILMYPTVGSLIMGGLVIYVRHGLTVGSFYNFLVLVVVGIIVYILIMMGLDWHFDYGLKSLLGQITSAVR